MSYQQERRFVLDMLETGSINLDQATRLLDILSIQPVSDILPGNFRQSPNKVTVEIDADQETLQTVLARLNQALSQVEPQYS